MTAKIGFELDFFWTVVHELRQPLTTISGEAQLAQQFMTSDPDRATRALNHLVSEIARVDRVLSELHMRARNAQQARAS